MVDEELSIQYCSLIREVEGDHPDNLKAVVVSCGESVDGIKFMKGGEEWGNLSKNGYFQYSSEFPKQLYEMVKKHVPDVELIGGN